MDNSLLDTLTEALRKETQQLQEDLSALRQYLRLKTEWHLDVPLQAERAMSTEEKMQYVRDTITLIDRMQTQFRQIRTLQERFMALESALRASDKGDYPASLRATLHAAYDARIEDPYTIEQYLQHLGPEPVTEPLVFFALESAHLERIITAIEQDNRELEAAIAALRSHTQALERSLPQPHPRSSSGTGDLLLDVLDALSHTSTRSWDRAWRGPAPTFPSGSQRGGIRVGDARSWGGSFTHVGTLSGMGRWGNGTRGKW